ncbi:hypothetical protein ACLOJK_026073 [Asimina triloba]
MDGSNSTATSVAQAIVAALDWSSSTEARRAAVSYLESIKAGDVRVLANTSFILVRRDWSSEIRLHAFKLLQHLVRLRWDEFTAIERRNFANVALESISETANDREEWALKSQTAALIAEAELVAMILRWLPEDITVHNEDLEVIGFVLRFCISVVFFSQLSANMHHLRGQGLQIRISLLDKHFGAALSEAGKQQIDIAKQHAATVMAALNAVNAYAEWAPVPDLAKYGLIHGSTSWTFLSSLTAVDFYFLPLSFVSMLVNSSNLFVQGMQKRPADASAADFDAAMCSIFQVLVNVSRDILYRSGSGSGSIDESEFEFAECICEAMASLGTSNLQCTAGDGSLLPLYLQQMLGYFQHFKLALHFQSLLFWLALMRELTPKQKAVSQTVGDNSVVGSSISGQGQLDKDKKGVALLVNDDICGAILEVSFQRMLKKSVQAVTTSAGALELWSEEFEGKGDFSQYRSRLLDLFRLVAFYKPLVAAARVCQRIETIIKNHLTSPVPAQQLLSLKWTEPALAEILGRYLDAFGPFLKHFPDAVGAVINKLFELLTSLPFALKDPSAMVARRARLQICTSFIRIAKAADKSLLPHMKGIADTMAYLQGEGQLLRGEHNLLGEAFLVMASTAGIQQQQEVLAWLLEPLSKQWVQVEWQNAYLSDPLGLLLRSIHSLWSQPVNQALPGELRAALSMSHVEQASLLGGTNAKLLKGASMFTDGSQIDLNKDGNSETNENDLRNWLKGIRDGGYNVLGLAATIGDSLFRCLESSSVALALMENFQSMEFRHIRQLIHLVLVPLVKFCPLDLWEEWLEKLLHPLFLHCQQALSCSWSGLLHEGRAKVPDIFGNLSGLELKVEVMEEKLLRDLTREICSLLSVLASSGLNTGLPSLEQFGNVGRTEVSLLKDSDAFAANSLVGFLLKHKGPALPALQICIEAFSWTDGEAMAKVASFCGAVILLAVSTNNVELREFVAKDMFYAIIQGLALESNAIISGDLVGLCREIFVYLSERSLAPRQVLLSLPCITAADLQAFEDTLTKTSSPKEQKLHMRSLLLLATGNKLKALAAQKITNIRSRQHVKLSTDHTNESLLLVWTAPNTKRCINSTNQRISLLKILNNQQGYLNCITTKSNSNYINILAAGKSQQLAVQFVFQKPSTLLTKTVNVLVHRVRPEVSVQLNFNRIAKTSSVVDKTVEVADKNFNTRIRDVASARGPSDEGDEFVGLAAII